MAFIQVEHVSKSYKLPTGNLSILHDLSFEIEAGEFVTITGPSGCGKTTLLALLGALDQPDSGTILVDGHSVHALGAVRAADYRRETIGFVFQLFYLLPNLSALENVMAPLLPYRRMLGFDLRKRAQELLEQVGLASRMGHTPARLSGGEQQRVAIARALINQPKVLLADEPTGNLDPETGREILELLREQQRQGKQTLVMVTHDHEIADIADRTLSLLKLVKAE
ncbi:putative ABC transport system ATP-binding protein/lipoprotein-releasing system ATP-binding protein [Thermosporothrix hazakensis]|uniref:Putative ABC transport system ATP-binding protein/lipoprotein-releasing system ATP-binding protein n=1 Tax=Thermosporothrix hazakensis TaxID=644383 RepID=A0A326U2H5_THEHA|nr:ABC transporter ATP-binding protein [Thermosporothrix hazakensis]PZW19495.1 putative ABC transport system ATP-binding protein/lipoprotein-releasing system ATP-binding protein [Thermosporothrix hazakensis]GCE51420.1 ABC transporter ATP-binding protein [Thermosporothrix hazakensis]